MNNYHFQAQVWRSEGKGGWYFVTLPTEISDEIRDKFKEYEEGWGRLQCQAMIKNQIWKTAIWFDTKKKSFLLPIKSEIRKKQGITESSIVNIVLTLNNNDRE